MTFKNQQRTRLEQGMIIAFSTIFGVGISLIIEAFLAGGVILLHKNTISEIRQEAKAIAGGSIPEQQKESNIDGKE